MSDWEITRLEAKIKDLEAQLELADNWLAEDVRFEEESDFDYVTTRAAYGAREAYRAIRIKP